MILVTGGGGYIGAVTVSTLLKAGYKVRVVDKFLFGQEPLAQVADKIEIIVADIRSLDDSVMDGVSAVIHLAGLSNDPSADFNPEANETINHHGSAHIAWLAKRRGISRFVFASSCAIYDRGGEGSLDLLGEDAPVAPVAAYARSKLAAERAILSLADDSFRPVILRQGTVYGWSPRMRYDLVVNTFVKCAFQTRRLVLHHGGQMWRPLIDVRDVAQSYVRCLEIGLDKIGGKIINIAHKNYQVRDIAAKVRDALHSYFSVEIVESDSPQPIRNYRVATHKMYQLLEFQPTISIEEAVHDMVERIQRGITADFDNPRYYNIRWLEILADAEKILHTSGGVF